MSLSRLPILLIWLFLYPLDGFAESTAQFRNDSTDDGVFSEGGYLEDGTVWGRMIGSIDAPPSLVWEIFIDGDQWNHYGIPRLIDSRLVSPTVAEAASAVKDADSFYQIMGRQYYPNTKIRRRGGTWSHHHLQYYDIPWPVANRWMVLDAKDDETKSSAGFFITRWKMRAGNLKTMEGFLTVEPLQDPKRTRLEYYVETDPGSHVPKFLVRWGVKKVMPRVIGSIRREAARRLAAPSQKKASDS